MENNFQRVGAENNTKAGRDFENQVMNYFASIGLILKKNVSLQIGIHNIKKAHAFDLGDEEKKIIVECKSHMWTSGDNVPSAKITTWDQAMYYFYASPKDYRKIFVVLKDFSEKKRETLCDYYLRTKQHLIPDDVEFWEFDENTSTAIRKHWIFAKNQPFDNFKK